MKTKTKRKCKNKKCTRRRKRIGGAVRTLKDAKAGIEEKRKLLSNPDVQAQLAKAAAEKPRDLYNIALDKAERVVDAYIGTLEAQAEVAKLGSNLATGLGPDLVKGVAAQGLAQGLGAQGLGPDLMKAQGLAAQELKLGENPLDKIENPLDKIENPLDKIENPLDKIENPLDKIENPLDKIKKQAGGRKKSTAQYKVPVPMMPLLRKKEANIIGGRIEASIKRFLG